MGDVFKGTVLSQPPGFIRIKALGKMMKIVPKLVIIRS